MNTLTKTAAVAVAALTLTIGSFASASDAQAFNGKKAVAFGLAATVVGAMIAAATKPSYAGRGSYVASGSGDCRIVERFDRAGNYRGTQKVCDLD